MPAGRLVLAPWLCSDCAVRALGAETALGLLRAALNANVAWARRRGHPLAILDVWGSWPAAPLQRLWPGVAIGGVPAPVLLRGHGPNHAEALALAWLMQAKPACLIVLDGQDLRLTTGSRRKAAPDVVRLVRRTGARIVGLCCLRCEPTDVPAETLRDWAEQLPAVA